jgi:amino acid permease
MLYMSADTLDLEVLKRTIICLYWSQTVEIPYWSILFSSTIFSVNFFLATKKHVPGVCVCFSLIFGRDKTFFSFVYDGMI